MSIGPAARPRQRRCGVVDRRAWCGGPTRGGRTTCSEACEQATRAEQLHGFIAAGVRSLEHRRAEGIHAEMTEAGKARVARRTSDLVRAAREWQRTHEWPREPGHFEREIAPGLVGVSVRDVVEATGLSAAYCRRIKRGEVVPHPMWWNVLLGIGARQDRS